MHDTVSPIEIRRSAITVVTSIIILEVAFMLLNLLLHLGAATYEYFVGDELFNYVFAQVIIFAITMVFRLMLIAKIVFDWLYTYWTIEKDLIVYHRGLIRKRTEEYTVSTIESASISQSLLGTMLNYGTIELKIPVLNKTIYLDSVPYPRIITGLISEEDDESGKDRVIYRNKKT